MEGRKIDLESHFITKEYVKALRVNREYPRLIVDEATKNYLLLQTADVPLRMSAALFNSLLDIEEERLKYVNQANVKQMLSLSAPGVERIEFSVAVELARKTNDFLSEVIERHPEEFGGFATLAPQDPGVAADELERAVRGLGLKGWKTHSNYGNTYIDNRKYWPILEKAERLDVPIFIHPTIPAIPQLRDYGYALAGPPFGFGVETAMCVMRLILSGAFDKFPRLKIVLGHLGEALPFLMKRIDFAYVRPWMSNEDRPKLAKKPSDYIRDNVYVLTSGNYHEPAFICTYQTLGVSKILFGTDYPYENMNECIQFIEKLPIKQNDKHKIYHLNAKNLNLI